jgi:sugar/nucleoside kinase (ribokinase family)
VDASDTVGAGDVFAAAMLASLATYQPGVGELTRIAERAMLAVADWLERRPPTRRPGAG